MTENSGSHAECMVSSDFKINNIVPLKLTHNTLNGTILFYEYVSIVYRVRKCLYKTAITSTLRTSRTFFRLYRNCKGIISTLFRMIFCHFDRRRKNI